MTIEQTITIPADHKVFVEFLAPKEIPQGLARIELTVTPITEQRCKPVKHSAFGRLNTYADPSRIPDENGVWETAVSEKYAIH